MRLTRRVPTLDLCKQLEAAGMPQGESYFVWWENVGGGHKVLSCYDANQMIYKGNNSVFDTCIIADAPTVAELGEMLCSVFDKQIEEYYWYSGSSKGGIEREYFGIFNRESQSDGECYDYEDYDSTEVDVRAKMLIYLLGKGLVTP